MSQAMPQNPSIALAALLLPLVLGQPADAEEPQAWNQQAVSELATQMADEIKRLRNAARKEPHIISAASTGKKPAATLYLDTLRKLDRTSAKLSRQLADGAGAEETRGTARRVDSLLRDLDEQGTRLHSTEWTRAFLEPARKLAAELRNDYANALPGDAPADGSES